MTRRISLLFASLILHLGVTVSSHAADPRLSLLQTTTGQTSLSVTLQQRPATLSLDVHLDTAAHTLDGLQFYIQVKPPAPATPTYAGAGTIGAGQGPFPSGENSSSIKAGDAVDSSHETFLFRSASGNYAASGDYNVITYSINTASLPAGTYVFTPFGEALTDSPNSFFTTTFATPGDFTFTVTPEPSALSLLAVSALLLTRRRNERAECGK